jgi:hypothetical protein
LIIEHVCYDNIIKLGCSHPTCSECRPLNFVIPYLQKQKDFVCPKQGCGVTFDNNFLSISKIKQELNNLIDEDFTIKHLIGE